MDDRMRRGSSNDSISDQQQPWRSSSDEVSSGSNKIHEMQARDAHCRNAEQHVTCLQQEEAAQQQSTASSILAEQSLQVSASGSAENQEADQNLNDQQKHRAGLITSASIRPTDVLCGRGNYDQPGNATFLRLCQSRRAEYLQADTFREKGRIASEILEELKRLGGGRFLQSVAGDHRKAARRAGAEEGGDNGGRGEISYWKEMDEKAVAAKIKQALRQKRAAPKRARAAASAGGDAQDQDQDQAAGFLSSSSAAYSSAGSNYGSDDAAKPAHGNRGMSPLNHAAPHDQLPHVQQQQRRYDNIWEQGARVLPTQALGPRASSSESNPLNYAADGTGAAPVQQQGLGRVTSVDSTPLDYAVEDQEEFALLDLLGTADLDTETLLQEDGGGIGNIGDDLEPTPLAAMPVPTHSTSPIGTSNNGSPAGAVPTLYNTAPSATSSHANAAPPGSSSSAPPTREDMLATVRKVLDTTRSFREQTTVDLQALGRMIYETLAPQGQSLFEPYPYLDDQPHPDDDPTPYRAKKDPRKQSSSTYRESLLERGYPISFATLVDCLVNPNISASDSYQSIDQVEEDLGRMLRDPDRYLFDPPPSSLDGQLRFPDNMLYGRKQEIRGLQSSFEQVVGRGKRGLVLLSGYSGCGKSALIDHIRPLVDKSRTMLISCKFDVQGRMQARSPLIFKAFDEYCKDLLNGDPNLLAEVQVAVRRALGSNVAVLQAVIPTLRGLVGDIEEGSDGDDDGTNEAPQEMNRLVYHVRDFVRAISSTHPVVMVFDDLQWANEQCLDVVSKLITDVETSSILFIGTYRENEIEQGDHPLEECLGEIAMAAVPMSNIHLDNLDRDSVNSLVSDTLHLSPRLTRPLADALHTKTRGNPLFVKQLMRSLYEEKLLHYSASSRRWEWNIYAIQEKDVADSAVKLLVGMMQSYGSLCQLMLRVASCLGSSFDSATIRLLYSHDSEYLSTMISHLDSVVKDGLVIRTGSGYRFSHDQIWQAACSLTPTEQREEMHLQIGRQLLKAVPPANFNAFLFTIVDQLDRGSALIADHDEKLTLARLNLQAGELAMSTSSFLQASIYLSQGTRLVNDEDWQGHHYDLCLRLFTACADSQLALANYDDAIVSIDVVLDNGRCIEDKLQAYYACTIAFIAQGKMRDALKLALSVLEELCETFPTDPDHAHVASTFETTRVLIQATNESAVLSMATMTDPAKVAAMRFALIATKCAYVISPNLFALFSFRMVQITLLSGLTPESSYAFAMFAVISGAFISTRGSEIERYCAKLALSLIAKFKGKYAHIVIAKLNHSTLPFTQPIRACLEQTEYSYKLGMKLGDVDWALSILPLVSQTGLFAGKRLTDLEAEMRSSIQELKTYKHYMLKVNLLFFQTVLNLSSDTTSNVKDPTILTGEAMDQEAMLAAFSDNQMKNVIRMFHLCRMFLAYVFRRYDVAAEIVEMHLALVNDSHFLYDVLYETFYRGLIAFAIIRQGCDNVEKWNGIAADALDKLRGWAKQGSEYNFGNKFDMLQAELSAINGDTESAAEAYDSAISKAGEHNFDHEQAFACERASMFYLDIGNVAEGKQYLRRARDAYVRWGATRKANDCTILLQGIDSDRPR